MRKELLGGLTPIPNLIHEYHKRRREKKRQEEARRRERREADALVVKRKAGSHE
jgi:hypothetical protein